MRLTVPASDLASIITAASLPTPRRNTLPIMGHLHLRAGDNSIRAIGSDLDTWSAATCAASVAASGDICAPADGLKSAITRMKGDVTLEVVGHILRLSAGRMRADLPALPATEFPLVAPKGDVTEIVGGIAALTACAPFMANEEARYYLCGVCMDGDTAVATDGRAVTTAPISGGQRQIIPAQAVPMILKTGGGLFVGETLWKCEAEGRVLTGKLVDGSFPDWRRFMPDSLPWVTVNAEEMADAIDAATLGAAARVVIDTTGGSIMVSGEGFADNAREAEIEAFGEVHEAGAQCFVREVVMTALSRHRGEITIKLGAAQAMLIEADDARTAAMGWKSVRNVIIGERAAA